MGNPTRLDSNGGPGRGRRLSRTMIDQPVGLPPMLPALVRVPVPAISSPTIISRLSPTHHCICTFQSR